MGAAVGECGVLVWLRVVGAGVEGERGGRQGWGLDVMWNCRRWCVMVWCVVVFRLERLTADQQVPGSNPGVPSALLVCLFGAATWDNS